MTLVDTNIIIDVFERDPRWFDWSMDHLAEAAADEAFVNAIVVAELSRNFDDLAALLDRLAGLSLAVEPLGSEAAFLAGKRFQLYRRSGRDEEAARILPDFLIGAHAQSVDAPLLTRDPRLYRRYFPDLTLITPETQP